MQLNFLSFRRGALSVTSTLVILGALLIPTSLAAQWFEYPSDGVPRKADGSVDMTAPTPRLADGKPDLSGVWTAGARNRPGEAAADDEPGDPQNISSSRNMADIGVDLPEGLPYQPWLVPIVEERTENQAIDDPHIRCLPDNFLRAYGLPHLLKFVHTSGLVVVLNEMNAGYRQVFFYLGEELLATNFRGIGGRHLRHKDFRTTFRQGIGNSVVVLHKAQQFVETRKPVHQHDWVSGFGVGILFTEPPCGGWLGCQCSRQHTYGYERCCFGTFHSFPFLSLF